jgi:two-component system, OmpR family, response regulator
MAVSDTVKMRKLDNEYLLRVAIVEDAANIRERLVRLVEEIGNMQVVGEADTEARAINICRFADPDALILDMQLAEGSGLGVLKSMGYASAPKKPFVIVLTSFPSPVVEHAARALGANWFLDKSCDIHRLAALLRNFSTSRSGSTASPTGLRDN